MYNHFTLTQISDLYTNLNRIEMAHFRSTGEKLPELNWHYLQLNRALYVNRYI